MSNNDVAGSSSEISKAAAPELGRYGVWIGGPMIDAALAAHVESLGFGAIWIGGSPAADLEHVESLIAATSHITLATGIVNIWTAEPHELADSYARIEAAHPGRLLLGIGMGHPEASGDKAKRPYSAIVEYLDVLDAAGVPAEQLMLAALGPRMLELARERTIGTHPYLVTPAWHPGARAILGPDRIIATEQRVVLQEDPAAARELGRPSVNKPYLGLVNYVNNLRRLGYSEDDLARPGSDHLIDDLVVYGNDATILQRLNAHLNAGADHVGIQLIAPRGTDLTDDFTHLAQLLGLG